MKKDIHPKYYPNAKVTCSCGNTFTVGSTVPDIQVGICSVCHPFWTGVKKLIDTEGLVDKFQRRQKVAKEHAQAAAKKAAKKAEQKKVQVRPKTFKEMMDLAREELGKESVVSSQDSE